MMVPLFTVERSVIGIGGIHPLVACGERVAISAARERAPVIGLPEYQRPEDVTLGNVPAMPFGPPCVAEASGQQAVGAAHAI